MKLRSLKLANAIRVGTEIPGESYFSLEKGYELELMPGGQIIRIISPSRNCKTFTTIYNVFYFDMIEEPAPAEPTTKKVRSEAAVN